MGYRVIVADMAAVMSKLTAPLERFTPAEGALRTAAQIALLTEQVFNLRLDGYTLHEIGAELGISHTYADNLLKKRLANTAVENIEDVRKIELDRLEKMHKKVEKFNAKLPDGTFSKDSIEVQLKIAARRAALQGLDSAQKFEVTTKIPPDALTGLTDEELLLIRQIIARVRGVMAPPQPVAITAPQQLEPTDGDA